MYTITITGTGGGVTRTATYTLTISEPVVVEPCFIATSAYGTALHDEIVVLRSFRDEYLMTNPIGRMFVKIYYKISSPIADVIRENEDVRKIVRVGFVEPLVYITRLFVER